ncbi:MULTISPECIES: hypothetical protein [Citrobacter]|jgi:uncharacterized phage protein gp47/JayE|uniref:hypothetical protein n=1 Tax=Citrobacter TaxID=544 RepID=UPI00066EC2A6|nr:MULTISPECIES: hypothetical protein [Citrobacter]EGT0642856.1 hypothetical protein [Citrobacter braakii]EGT0677806.1 hypothetical protein [Citrobacter braakii]EHG7890266.1 hypothetical protein [Citrobacter braakii]MBJ9569588.1 hypothetical protein [Citrobacter braakii]MCF2472434.1 hypothetical protein [Citrobacter braakii]
MTFHVPTVAKSTDRQLRDIQNALPDENADTSSDSDYAVRANAVSGVADDLYAYQGWIIRQIFPDTAEKEYLEFTRCRTGWTGHQCE